MVDEDDANLRSKFGFSVFCIERFDLLDRCVIELVMGVVDAICRGFLRNGFGMSHSGTDAKNNEKADHENL